MSHTVTSVREAALLALLAVLHELDGPRVLRNADRPARVPGGGIVVLRDGEPVLEDMTLGQTSYAWEHQAEIEVAVGHEGEADRHAALDALLGRIGSALAADPTLGGAVDWCAPGAPVPDDLAADGAETLRTAILPVTLLYVTQTPL